MRIRSLFGTLVELLDHDHLLSCLSSLENDGNFAGLVHCNGRMINDEDQQQDDLSYL